MIGRLASASSVTILIFGNMSILSALILSCIVALILSLYVIAAKNVHRLVFEFTETDIFLTS